MNPHHLVKSHFATNNLNIGSLLVPKLGSTLALEFVYAGHIDFCIDEIWPTFLQCFDGICSFYRMSSPIFSITLQSSNLIKSPHGLH